MTTPSTQHLVTGGADGEPMPTVLNAAEFADECRRLTETLTGDPLHKAMDRLSNELLCNLGFGEGVAVFIKAVQGYHSSL